MSAVIQLADGQAASKSGKNASKRRTGAPRLSMVLLWAGIVALGFFVPSVVDSQYALGVLTNTIILGAAAVSVGFLAYQCGLMMFGAAAITGGASYLFAIAVADLDLDVTAASFVALAACTAFAAVIGALVMRTRPLPFAMLTLALGQMLKSTVSITAFRPITGGDDGLALTFKGTFFGLTQAQLGKPETFWPVAWLAISLVVVLAWCVGRSRSGQVLRAITANEERMRFSGFNTYWPRVIAFTITGFIGAVSGVLTGLHQAFVSPELLDFVTGGNALISTLLGGFSSVFGPILGALLYVIGQEQFGASGQLELYTGVGVVLVIAIFPRGAMGFIHDAVDRLKARRTRNERPKHAAH